MQSVDLVLSLLALIVLEVILGIDNLVFLSILTERLPLPARQKARRWGLLLAWVGRLVLLCFAIVLVKLTHPFVTFGEFQLSLRDVFLIAGGGFLIAKATQEIHREVDVPAVATVHPTSHASVSPWALRWVIIQVVLMDLVFSLDSVLTAIGLTSSYGVMATAITVAIVVMLYANEPVSHFIETHPTLKMLALSFLILIGMVLIADGFAFHIPRGYVYFSMGFSLGVEGLNVIKKTRHLRKR